MSELTEIKHITLQDLCKEQFSDQVTKKIMEIEKLRMQRIRAANKGVWKRAVDVYNKAHTDSKLKLIADGIVVEYKTNDN